MRNIWHSRGSVVGLGAAAAVLALLVQSGGAVAGSAAPAPGHTPSRALTATHGTTVTSRFFGMHAPLLGREFPDAPVGAVDLTANTVYWPQLETSPGVFDFATRLDPMIAQARQHRVPPLIVLGETPSFHTATPDDPYGRASVPDMEAWKTYVRAAATHLQTQFPGPVDYQIWPEPNVKNNFAGTPQQMAELVVAAAKIIHQVAPAATVVAPAMVLRLSSERVFMKAFFAARVNGVPVGNYVDAVGVDPYPLQAGTPEDALALIAQAQRVLAAARVAAPVWTLEINYGVPVGGVTTAPPLPTRTQVSYVIRTYILNAAADVQRVYWLGWLKYFNLGVTMVADDGVTPTAPGLAFSRVHTWLIGQHARGCTYDSGSGLYACRFVRAGSSSWAYWVRSGSARVHAPAGVRHAQTMYGAVWRVRQGDRIRVTNAPVWVYR